MVLVGVGVVKASPTFCCRNTQVPVKSESATAAPGHTIIHRLKKMKNRVLFLVISGSFHQNIFSFLFPAKTTGALECMIAVVNTTARNDQ
jgi:hypothetical protein